MGGTHRDYCNIDITAVIQQAIAESDWPRNRIGGLEVEDALGDWLGKARRSARELRTKGTEGKRGRKRGPAGRQLTRALQRCSEAICGCLSKEQEFQGGMTGEEGGAAMKWSDPGRVENAENALGGDD